MMVDFKLYMKRDSCDLRTKRVCRICFNLWLENERVRVVDEKREKLFCVGLKIYNGIKYLINRIRFQINTWEYLSLRNENCAKNILFDMIK